jgi:hypothetical protein
MTSTKAAADLWQILRVITEEREAALSYTPIPSLFQQPFLGLGVIYHQFDVRDPPVPYFHVRYEDESYLPRTRYLILRNDAPPLHNPAHRYRRTVSPLRECGFRNPFIPGFPACGFLFTDHHSLLRHWAAHFDGPRAVWKTVCESIGESPFLPVATLGRILMQMWLLIQHPCIGVPLMGPSVAVVRHAHEVITRVLRAGSLVIALSEPMVAAFCARLGIWARSLADIGSWCDRCGEVLACREHELAHHERHLFQDGIISRASVFLAARTNFALQYSS